MHKNTLRKITSWQLLAVFAISVLISAFGPLALNASVAADTPTPPKNQATWFYNPERCTQSSDEAQAALAYTDSNGKTTTFHCEFITNSPNTSQNYMELVGPMSCNNNPAPIIDVGQQGVINQAPLASAKQGKLTLQAQLSPNGICQLGTTSVTIQLTNTYQAGSVAPPIQYLGTGTWTEPYVADQAEIKANYTFDLGSGQKYASPKDETFDQVNLSADGMLTLTSKTQAAPGTPCDGNTITYGPDPTSKDATVTINLWGYENGSDLHCYQRTGYIKLNKSFSDVGGALDTSGTTTGFSNGNCPIKGDGDWLFCMIADVTSGAIDALSAALQTMLYTPVDQIFGGKGVQAAFDSFRNIGVVLLVIVGLFMVLSQAAGLEIFAAYTVRKALPRLVLAMIGISLAWPILQFVVTFFNDIGVWAMQLILAAAGTPASGAPLSSFNFGTGVTLVAGVGSLLVFSTGIFMSLLGTLLLALVVGFIVLAIRQLVILIAIVLAPLAIAASILPSTQKIWNFWRESLLTALAMFPIIMAFLGAGKAMSVIAADAANATPDAGRSFTWKLLSVTCLIAALGALPVAFRIAGGIVGTAHSLVTGSRLGKGAFGALSAYRGKKFAERWEDTKGGRLMRPGSLLSRIPGVDKASDFASGWASTGALIASGHISRGRRNAYRANAEAAHALEMGAKDTDFQPARGNEDYYFAGMRGHRYKYKDADGTEHEAVTDGTEAGARAYFQRKGYAPGATLRNAVGQTMLMKRKLGQQGFDIAAAMYTPGSGTAFGEGGVAEMDETIATAARGDKGLAAQILNVARQNAAQAGRIDLSGAGFATHLREIYNVMDGGTANGDRLTLEAFMATDAVTLTRAKKKTVELTMGAVTREMTHLQGKAPMTEDVEMQITGLQNQLQTPGLSAGDRTRIQSNLQRLHEDYATEEEQRTLGRLKESLDRVRQQSLQYAAPEKNIPIYDAINKTYGAQRVVEKEVADEAKVPRPVDAATGNKEPMAINQQVAYGAEEQQMRNFYSNGANSPWMRQDDQNQGQGQGQGGGQH